MDQGITKPVIHMLWDNGVTIFNPAGIDGSSTGRFTGHGDSPGGAGEIN